ncbi:MAG: acyltransferase family protein [Phenylobacterium sp.]|uniref:acyltransferase family protein n=1 Tax=Phenylobacterium sp. TaxID=1871053 RepID=UPI00391CA14F
MPAAASTDRRYDLDWIRVIAFGLLILYHVGMFYVPWDWHVKSPQPVEWLEPVMMFTNPWRLTLLFLVSGAATRFMADKMSAGALTRSRVARLLPPLAFAMFVIVPPQSYYEIVEQIGYAGTFADFYPRYATSSGRWCDADGCLITPTWNHMWFVAYLLVYSLALGGLLALARGRIAAVQKGLEQALAGPGVLIWPAAFLILLRLTLAPLFEITHALVDDWYNHALSFSAFLFGFLIAKSERLKAGFVAWRWPALALALAAYGCWAGYVWVYRGEGAVPPEALRWAGRVAYGLDQWAFIAAALGFGARHLNRGGPALRYLTVGVFPFYIVHQTVIVVAGHHLARAGLPQALEAAVLIAVTFAACFASYEIVRRLGPLRPLFGLKGAAAANAGASTAAARA